MGTLMQSPIMNRVPISIVLFYLTVSEAAIIDTDNLRNGELISSNKPIHEQMENDESFDEDDIAKDDIARKDVVKDDIAKNDTALTSLGIAILRCCTSSTDPHIERCFEINGFGGIRFAEEPCSYLPTVTSLLQSL